MSKPILDRCQVRLISQDVRSKLSLESWFFNGDYVVEYESVIGDHEPNLKAIFLTDHDSDGGHAWYSRWDKMCRVPADRDRFISMGKAVAALEKAATVRGANPFDAALEAIDFQESLNSLAPDFYRLADEMNAGPRVGTVQLKEMFREQLEALNVRAASLRTDLDHE